MLAIVSLSFQINKQKKKSLKAKEFFFRKKISLNSNIYYFPENGKQNCSETPVNGTEKPTDFTNVRIVHQKKTK